MPDNGPVFSLPPVNYDKNLYQTGIGYSGVENSTYLSALAAHNWDHSLAVQAFQKDEYNQLGLQEGTPLLSPEEANKKYGIRGHLNFDEYTFDDQANFLHNQKNQELQRMEILSRAQGFGQKSLGVGLSLAEGFLDPINLAATFIPVVGEARYVQLLKTLGPVGARLTAGAINNAVVTAALEIPNYELAQSMQKDYTMQDALMNIGISAIVGGALHTAGRLTKRGRAYDHALLWNLDPETQVSAFKSAVADVASGREVRSPSQITELDTHVLEARAAEDPSIRDTYGPEFGTDSQPIYFEGGETKVAAGEGKEGFVVSRDFEAATSKAGANDPIVELVAGPEARILREGSGESAKIEARAKELSDASGVPYPKVLVAEAAKEGYHAVEFIDQKNFGTVILDKSQFTQEHISDVKAKSEAWGQRAEAIKAKAGELQRQTLDSIKAGAISKKQNSMGDDTSESISPADTSAPETKMLNDEMTHEDQMTTYQEQTDAFLKDHNNLVDEPGAVDLERFDKQISEAEKYKKALLEAAGCVTASMGLRI